MAEPTRKGTKKTAHWHGCRRCPTAYEDNCTDTKVDGLCAVCRGGRGFQILIDNRRPRPCCAQARVATKDQRKQYRLAGERAWWICPGCARTQPFNPAQHPDRFHVIPEATT